MSPGNLPNQFNNQGAKCIIAPKTSNIAPAIMIHRAIKSILFIKIHVVKKIGTRFSAVPLFIFTVPEDSLLTFRTIET